MSDAKRVHLGLRVEDTGARREDPHIGNGKGVGASRVVKDGEDSVPNGVRDSMASGIVGPLAVSIIGKGVVGVSRVR